MNFERIALLLEVEAGTREQPKLQAIRNAAHVELQEINDYANAPVEPKEQPVEEEAAVEDEEVEDGDDE